MQLIKPRLWVRGWRFNNKEHIPRGNTMFICCFEKFIQVWKKINENCHKSSFLCPNASWFQSHILEQHVWQTGITFLFELLCWTTTEYLKFSQAAYSWCLVIARVSLCLDSRFLSATSAYTPHLLSNILYNDAVFQLM